VFENEDGENIIIRKVWKYLEVDKE
jgi:hypothetical protein